MDNIIVGIDVSKDRLDVALRPSGEVFAVELNRVGLERLVVRLRELSPRIVALEATGGFEVIVAAALAAAEPPVAIVNPAQIRAFAKAIGQRAKTENSGVATWTTRTRRRSDMRALRASSPSGVSHGSAKVPPTALAPIAPSS